MSISLTGWSPVNLTSLSFAYPDVPANERAEILEPRALVGADGTDVFFLATCLRVEIAWTGVPDLAPTVLTDLYGSVPLPAAKMRTGLDAFHHLSRVSAGLESAQVGEDEVLAQFRQASERLVESARDATLLRMLEMATGVGRSGRRLLNGGTTGSLAGAAAQMVATLPEVVVLGDGAMARAVVAELDPAKTAVYSRRPKPVAGIESRPWTEVEAVLGSCRAVVSTIPGPIPVLEQIERPEDPLLIVDLGMPPALRHTGPSNNVVYRGVDDAASTVRAASEPAAEEAVAVESEKAWRRLTVTHEAGSIITSVFERVDSTVDEEVSRFGSRLTSAADPEQVLRQLAHTVARRIIHPSVSFLGSTPLEPGELDVLAKAFGVEDE